MSKPTMVWATLHQRCPRCRQGEVFTGPFRMNPRCGFCGLKFEREPGYFLGAMAFSYFFAVAGIGIFSFLLHLLFPELGVYGLLFVGAVAFLPFVPVVFRLSRSIWMHIDRAIDPGN